MTSGFPPQRCPKNRVCPSGRAIGRLLAGVILSSLAVAASATECRHEGAGERAWEPFPSSHVGDEFAERTGRRRISYTRQEILLGIRREIGLFTAYAEGAWGTGLRTEELQEPGRLQAGLELRSRRFWADRVAWLAAIDLTAWEERDWSVDRSLWLGLAWPRPERTWPAGVAYRNGRVPLGEFFQDDETYVGFGLWLDF